MKLSLQGKVGMELKTFTFEIEKGKIREFALAIGDNHPSYESGESLPPTFATVMEMWGGADFFEIIERLELDITNVLHGEQEYIYLGKIKVGDKVTGITKVKDVLNKKHLDIYKLETHFKNEAGETVLISKNTVIERQ